MVLALAAALGGLLAAAAPGITVYAAASLRAPLQQLAPACERAAGARLAFNFGASSDLARQIVAAGKADLFFAADEAWMDHVAAEGLLDPGWRRGVLSNRLVVVAAEGFDLPIGSAAELAAAPFRRVSLGHPEGVPVGRYAKAWLAAAGRWEAVAGRVLPGVDARAALAAVESGAAEVGIVYATDAALSARVRVVHAVPPAEVPRIVYSLAVLGARPAVAAARAAAACLAGPEAGAVFARFGFEVLERPDPR